MWLILGAGSVVAQGPVSNRLLGVGAWVLVVLFSLNTVGNLRGTDPLERWGPSTLTTVLAILCAVIAVNR